MLSPCDYRNIERYQAFRAKVGHRTVELPKDLPEECVKQLCDVLAAHGYLPTERQGIVTVVPVRSWLMHEQCA